MLALGHGAGGGIEARDLQALAGCCPPPASRVALVEQPWRVAGKKVAPAPKTLDAAWRALWPALAAPGLPVVAGGRSAGARVACRTARNWAPRAVLALSLPAAPPGQAGEVPCRGADGAGVPHARGAGRQRPLRAARGVPRGDDGSWRCRTAITASPSPSARTSGRRRPWRSLTEAVRELDGRHSGCPGAAGM